MASESRPYNGSNIVKSLLDEVKKNARWRGRDNFPSNEAWDRETNRWFAFAKKHWRFDQYLPRLRDMPSQRNEALAELAVAYFLTEKKDLKLIEFDPIGKNGKCGEFLFQTNDGSNIFCEVKSPGWEGDFASRGHKERLKMPKFVNGEAGGFDNKTNLRHVIENRAYPKCPNGCLTLVVIADDFMVSLAEDKSSLPSVLFHEQRKPPYVDKNSDGTFVTSKFENLSAVASLNFDCYVGEGQIRYSWAFFNNPKALHKFDKNI